jgi:hypothetical protein
MIDKTLECVPQIGSHTGRYSKLTAEDKANVDTVNCNYLFLIDGQHVVKQM